MLTTHKKILTMVNLNIKDFNKSNENIQREIISFKNLIAQLEMKELSLEVITLINIEITRFNNCSALTKDFIKILRKKRKLILQNIRVKQSIYPKKYFSQNWTALGMIAFGPCIGVILSGKFDSWLMILAGIFLCSFIGGLAGYLMDKKVSNNGKQINW
ncbi:MAG: hypothetical protein JEY94_05765 [Melioribacteraceae bacterium]|nr:hypothetical protein [Melioribacteraceae bacterium]